MTYVHWYNNERLHGQLANVNPEEYEQAYYAALAESPPGDALESRPA